MKSMGRHKSFGAFWSSVDRANYGSCWIWTGKVHANGYGQLRWHGRPAYAHRVAYEIVNGPIPVGCAIKRTKCKDKLCVNPKHWRLNVFVSPMHVVALEKRAARLKAELKMVERRLAIYRKHVGS